VDGQTKNLGMGAGAGVGGEGTGGFMKAITARLNLCKSFGGCSAESAAAARDFANAG
jgi:hypothetical protein